MIRLITFLFYRHTHKRHHINIIKSKNFMIVFFTFIFCFSQYIWVFMYKKNIWVHLYFKNLVTEDHHIWHQKVCIRVTIYLVAAKGCAFFWFSPNAVVGHCYIPETLHLQLPVVGSWRKYLTGDHLRPVVKAVRMLRDRQAVFDPHHCP